MELRGGVAGRWRIQHYVFCGFHFSPYILGVIMSTEVAMHKRFWLQDLEGIDCLEVRGVDASIILKES